jgi:signal transduction histidine kinase
MHLSAANVDPGPLLKEAIERFDHVISDKHLGFQARVASTKIFVDPALIERAPTNLLSNAVRRCPHGDYAHDGSGASWVSGQLEHGELR